MKNLIFLLGLAIAAQAQTFETHVFTKENFPETKFELCRELAAVKAESIAKSEREKIEVFQRTYSKCMEIPVGEI